MMRHSDEGSRRAAQDDDAEKFDANRSHENQLRQGAGVLLSPEERRRSSESSPVHWSPAASYSYAGVASSPNVFALSSPSVSPRSRRHRQAGGGGGGHRQVHIAAHAASGSLEEDVLSLSGDEVVDLAASSNSVLDQRFDADRLHWMACLIQAEMRAFIARSRTRYLHYRFLAMIQIKTRSVNSDAYVRTTLLPGASPTPALAAAAEHDAIADGDHHRNSNSSSKPPPPPVPLLEPLKPRTSPHRGQPHVSGVYHVDQTLREIIRDGFRRSRVVRFPVYSPRSAIAGGARNFQTEVELWEQKRVRAVEDAKEMRIVMKIVEEQIREERRRAHADADAQREERVAAASSASVFSGMIRSPNESGKSSLTVVISSPSQPQQPQQQSPGNSQRKRRSSTIPAAIQRAEPPLWRCADLVSPRVKWVPTPEIKAATTKAVAETLERSARVDYHDYQQQPRRCGRPGTAATGGMRKRSRSPVQSAIFQRRPLTTECPRSSARGALLLVSRNQNSSNCSNAGGSLILSPTRPVPANAALDDPSVNRTSRPQTRGGASTTRTTTSASLRPHTAASGATVASSSSARCEQQQHQQQRQFFPHGSFPLQPRAPALQTMERSRQRQWKRDRGVHDQSTELETQRRSALDAEADFEQRQHHALLLEHSEAEEHSEGQPRSPNHRQQQQQQLVLPVLSRQRLYALAKENGLLTVTHGGAVGSRLLGAHKRVSKEELLAQRREALDRADALQARFPEMLCAVETAFTSASSRFQHQEQQQQQQQQPQLSAQRIEQQQDSRYDNAGEAMIVAPPAADRNANAKKSNVDSHLHEADVDVAANRRIEIAAAHEEDADVTGGEQKSCLQDDAEQDAVDEEL